MFFRHPECESVGPWTRAVCLTTAAFMVIETLHVFHHPNLETSALSDPKNNAANRIKGIPVCATSVPSHKFLSITLYDQPFSSYRPF